MWIAAMIVAGVLVALAVGDLVDHNSDRIADNSDRVARKPHRRVSREAVVGGFCSGCLVALAFGDLFIKSQREWWEHRPMFAAGISGALLLGLTVLVVEAILEHGNTLRRRIAATDPVVGILKQADGAHEDVKTIIRGQPGDIDAILARSETALEGIVVRTRTMTPLLTASNELLELYKRGETFTDEASKLRDACRAYRDSLRGPEESVEVASVCLEEAYLKSDCTLEAFRDEAIELKFVKPRET